MGLAVDLDDVWESYRTRRRRSRRGREWALAGLDLEIPAGELFGVVGPNGAGKTTLLQVIAGVLQPTRGTCTTSGRVSSLVELGAGISRDLSGRENLLVGGVLLGLSRREIREKYDEIVAFTGLDDATLDEAIRTYSAGMSLRLAFSVVLHSDPAVLLVDEVLAVGDESFQARGLARIDELRAGGTAVVLVSHDLDLIERHCERVGILTEGRFEHVGDTVETVARYREIAAASTGEVDGNASLREQHRKPH